jgi:hypothetical protein
VTGETFVGRLLHSILFYDAPPWVFAILYSITGAIVLVSLLLCTPRRPFARVSRQHQPDFATSTANMCD